MKQIIFILMLLLISQLVLGITIKGGEEFNVLTIDKCYGVVQVKVEQTNNETIDYKLNDCKINQSFWNCDCKENETNINFVSTANNNEYDFIVQYYIGINYTETDKRVKQINNIKVETVKPSEPIVFPSFNNPTVLLAGGIIFAIFVVIMVLLFRYIMKDDTKTDIPIVRKGDMRSTRDDKLDREVDEILKGL